jgi:hypothetical protein
MYQFWASTQFGWLEQLVPVSVTENQTRTRSGFGSGSGSRTGTVSKTGPSSGTGTGTGTRTGIFQNNFFGKKKSGPGANWRLTSS